MAVHGGEQHVADIIDRLDLSRRPDQVLLALALDVAGADVGVVAVQRRHDVGQRQAVGRQLLGVRRHQVFLGVAADGIDFRHAGNVAHLRLDHPVLDLAQVGGGIGRAVGLARAVLGLDRPKVDLAQAGRDRPQRGRYAFGKILARLLQSFVDQLAREIDVGAVVEDHRDLRQPVARQRAGLFQAGQAGHHGLDRVGDALLGLQRRIARRGRVDLHLHVGDIGHGVDGQPRVVVDADGGHGQRDEQHHPALFDGKADQAFKHVCSPWLSARGRRWPCPARTSARRRCPSRSARPGPGRTALRPDRPRSCPA